MYTFNINDRTYIDETVTTANGSYKYETSITAKANSRAGYSFKWSDNNTNYQRTFNIIQNTTLAAVYTTNTDTHYKVEHKLINTDLTTFTVANELNLTGTTDAPITPSVNSYTGFVSPDEQTYD